MQLDHLNLTVSDLNRSRQFYERHFGFAEGPPIWHRDVLFLRNSSGFDLALASGDRPTIGKFHFGFHLAEPDLVRILKDRFAEAGVQVFDVWDEPEHVGFKCLDPDGYEIEVYWE